MALLFSGITQRGYVDLPVVLAANTAYYLGIDSQVIFTLRYSGYFYVSRAVPGLGVRAQIRGIEIWTKWTALEIGALPTGGARLGVAWKYDGAGFEIRD